MFLSCTVKSTCDIAYVTKNSDRKYFVRLHWNRPRFVPWMLVCTTLIYEGSCCDYLPCNITFSVPRRCNIKPPLIPLYASRQRLEDGRAVRRRLPAAADPPLLFAVSWPPSVIRPWEMLRCFSFVLDFIRLLTAVRLYLRLLSCVVKIRLWKNALILLAWLLRGCGQDRYCEAVFKTFEIHCLRISWDYLRLL